LHGVRGRSVLPGHTRQNTSGCFGKRLTGLVGQAYATDQRFQSNRSFPKHRTRLGFAKNDTTNQADRQRVSAASGESRAEQEADTRATCTRQLIGNLLPRVVGQAGEALKSNGIAGPLFKQRSDIGATGWQSEHLFLQRPPSRIEIEHPARGRWIAAYRRALDQEIGQPSLCAKPRVDVPHAKRTS